MIGLLTGLLMSGTCAVYAQNKIIGNGDVQTVDRKVSDFNAIVKSGSVDMVLVPAAQEKVTVIAESNIQPYIQTEVTNGVLHIYTKTPQPSNLKVHKLEVVVAVNQLKSLSLDGSGDVKTTGTLSSPAVSVDKNGSGDLELNINAESLIFHKNGSGDISIDGNIKDLQIKDGSSGDMVLKGSGGNCTIVKSGSGDLRAPHFVTGNMTISNSGSGDAEIRAEKTITIKNSGSGDIEYSGSAEVTHSVKTGSGDIEKR